MDILTQIPLGSKLKVKASGDVVTLEAIKYYPTRYETINESGKIEYYRTHEVELLEVPEEN